MNLKVCLSCVLTAELTADAVDEAAALAGHLCKCRRCRGEGYVHWDLDLDLSRGRSASEKCQVVGLEKAGGVLWNIVLIPRLS